MSFGEVVFAICAVWALYCIAAGIGEIDDKLREIKDALLDE